MTADPSPEEPATGFQASRAGRILLAMFLGSALFGGLPLLIKMQAKQERERAAQKAKTDEAKKNVREGKSGEAARRLFAD